MLTATLVASTPNCDEAQETLDRCLASTAGCVDDHYIYEASQVGAENTDAMIRSHGLNWALAVHAEWWLQLDADERLVNGQTLRARLARGWARAYALPYLQEDGQLTFAPYRLVRLPCRLVCGCHFFTWTDGVVWDLSGEPVPHEWRQLALSGPHVVHEPSKRPARTVPRLSLSEGVIETRPADAVRWALHEPLRLGGDMPFDPTAKIDEAGEVVDEREWYCPACGLRYEVPGICRGTVEAPHPPEQTEKVSEAASDTGPVPQVPVIETQTTEEDEAALARAEQEVAERRARILEKQATPPAHGA